MHRTCFVRMVNNIKYRGYVQVLWLLAVQKYAFVLGSSVCVKQCIVVSEYSCFLLLLQPFEHESARSFVCCINHTAPDIRLTRARFPPLLTLPPSRSSAWSLFRLAAVPPPAASSLLPPIDLHAGRALGLLPVILGAPRGCPKVFFLLKIKGCLVRICFVRICLRLFLPIHSLKTHPCSWYPYQTPLFLLKKNH